MRDKKKVELKECPFCGGKAKVTRTIYYEFYVRCLNTGMNDCRLMPQTFLGRRKEAIEAWNTRKEKGMG